MKLTEKIMRTKHLDLGISAMYVEATDTYTLPVLCARCRDVLGCCDDVSLKVKGTIRPHTLEDCVLALGKTVQGLTDRLLHHKLL